VKAPDLNYETTGGHSSPTFLFLHGFMGSSADWREVMGAMGDRTHCIAVDLPGHGASLGLPPDTYTIEGATRAVIRTLDDLQIFHPIVAGYSMGGRLALYLALRYPERRAGLEAARSTQHALAAVTAATQRRNDMTQQAQVATVSSPSSSVMATSSE
jgi:2-succinyl-6-hydroxy-2,4-cyclohexadiene-1-carboxylate synthase